METKFILQIKYRAITWDNYQGGSGLPFNGKKSILVDGQRTINELNEIAKTTCKAMKTQFNEVFEITSLELIEVE